MSQSSGDKRLNIDMVSTSQRQISVTFESYYDLQLTSYFV